MQNPESLKKRKESRKRASDKYFQKNRDLINAKSYEKYWADPASARKYALSRYYQNPQATIDRNRVWRKENRESARKYSVDRYARMPEVYAAYYKKHRAKRLGVDSYRITPEQFRQKSIFWGDKCWICRVGAVEHWDHVKPIFAGGPHLLANLRPACAECNQLKGSKWFGPQSLGELVDYVVLRKA